MAMNGGQIEFGIGFKVDNTGFQSVKTQLQDLMNLTSSDYLNFNPSNSLNKAEAELKEIQEDIKQIQVAYDGAFDSTTGVININKLSSSLKGMDLNKIYSSFKKLGPEGVKAFNDITNQVTKVNLKFKETNNFLEKMGQTLVNTIKWNISSSIVNKFTGSIQQAWGYAQHLDDSLNDIRIVTSKSADEMDKFSEKANKAAGNLGASTTDYTEAALIYYQQGLSDEESQARAETTVKAANVTGQTGREVSEELTAVWNGYKVTAEETEEYVDKLAAVAASTASDLEELSTGMSKVASAANNMGVDIDQLNAQLATIISVTRQAPESAGTALKTIYARMEDLKIDGTDEDGVKLGEVSSTLDEVGVHIMDAEGNMRDLGEVIEEVGNKWTGWTRAQQDAIAQAIAGKRQYNNLLALFDSWDMYNTTLETSRNAIGTLQEQQDIYMERTSTHLQQLKTAQEGLYDSLISTEDANSVIDVFTVITEKFEGFIDSIGGGKSLLLGLVGVLGQIPGISTSISSAIGDAVQKTANGVENAQSWNTWIKNMEGSLVKDTSAYEAQKELLDSIKSTTESLTLEERKRVSEQMEQLKNLGAQQDILQSAQDRATTVVQETALALDNSEENNPAYEEYEGAKFNDLLSKDKTTTVAEMFQAQEDAAKEAEQELENYKQKLQEIIELKEQYGDNAKYSQELDELEEIQAKLKNKLEIIEPSSAGEVNKVFKKLEEVNGSLKDGSASSKDLQKNLKTIGTVGATSFKTVQKTQEEVMTTLAKGNQELDKAKGNFNKAADGAKDMVNGMSADKVGQSITNLVSGFSSLAFSMQAIKNIGSIWSNEELTTSEKMFQTITALTTSLPMLLTGLSSVSTGATELQNSLTYINDIIAKSTEVINQRKAAAEANNVVRQQETVVSEENAAAETAEAEAKVANEAVTEAEAAAAETDAVAKETETGANIAEAVSEDTDTAAKATNEVTTGTLISTIGAHIAARLTEKVTVLGVTAALGAYVAVAAVAVGAIAAIVYAVNKHEESMRNANDAIIEQSNNAQEQINTNNELADSYLELYKQYKETGEVSDELKEAAEQCTETLDIQRGSVQLLAEDYDGLAESIKKAKKEESKKGLDSAKKEKNAAEGNLLDSATDGVLNNGVGNQTSIVIGYGANTAEEKDAIQVLQSNLADTSAEYFDQLWSGTIVTDYDAESILEIYDALVKTRDELAASGQQSTDVYKNISAWIDQTTEDVEAYRAAVQDIETYATQLAGIDIDENQIVDIESYSKIRDDTIKKIKEATGIEDDERAANLADAWLAQNLGEESQEYMNQFNAAANLFTQYENQIDGLTQEKVQELVSKMVQDDTFKYQAYMTDEDWKNILGAKSAEDAEVYIQDVIDRHQEDIKKSIQEQASVFSDSMQTIIDNVNSGDLTFANIGSDETFKTMKDNIDDLLIAFPELTEEASVFLTEGMVGSEEWAEAAYQIKDAYDQLEFQQLNDNLDDAFEELKKFTNEGQYDENGVKINVDADTDDFQDAIENVLNAKYAIDVKLYTDGVQEFEDLEESMQDIDTMASKIGEDFIVAADDIRELNNTFPGILEGMEYLADGTVQLNEEVVESAMDAATAEETTSADATATKLENTATELRAKADMYDDMADLAEDAANGEADVAEQKQKIINQLNQLETENDQKVADSEIDNSHAVVDDSAENAPILAENWTKAYEEAAQSANDWATLATAANKAVANGEDWNADEHKGDFAVNFTGSKSKTTTSTTVAKVQNADQSTMKDIANTFRNTATTYRKNANDLEGAAAELRAKSLNSANTNANVGSTKTSSSNNDSTDSSNDPDTEDYLERTTDLYREINEELDDIESTLGRIQTIDEHSWGASSLAALKEENSLLEEQYDLLTKKKDTYESDLSSQRQSLENQGITFSQDGSVMTNAESKLNTLYAEYNTMVDSYNSMTADEQETYKSTLEAKKETIEDLEDAIDKYEDSYNNYNDVLDELLDTHYELIENAVNQFNAEIDVKLELDEAEDAWNDFWYDVVQDIDDTDFSGKIAKSIDKLNTYVGQLTGTESSQISSLTDHLNDTITEVNKQIEGANKGGGDSIFKDDTALSKETLTNYRDKLITAVKTAKEEIDSIVENYLNILDDAQDKIDKQVEGWESINDHIEHNLSLIKKVSGSKAYEALNKQFNQQYEANLQLVETQKQSVDYWKERMSYYQQMMATENEGSKMYNMYSESLKKASENYKDAVKDLDKSIEDAIGDLEEWRENQVSAIEDAFEKSISKDMGLDLMSEEWDLAIDKQEYYLDNIEKAIELESLQNDFKDALNGLDARNEKQKELLAFMDEENKKLQEKNKLTQYDIDEVKARLEIKKAELALEEAQKNKSNLRLRRDSQGNYSYQYTADTDQIEESESGVLSAKKAWYDLVKQRNKETREYIQEQLKTLYSDMEAYNQALADNDYEKAENIKKLIEERRAYILELTSESEKAQRDMFQGTAQIFADTTTAQMLPMWSTALAEMTEKWAGDGSSSFTGAVTQAIEDLQVVQEAFASKTEKILEKAGVNYENLVENGIDPTTKSLNDMQDSNEKLNESLKETNSTLSTLQDNLKTTIDAYNDLKDAAVNAINDANDALNTLANTTVKQVNQIKTAVNTINNANNNNNPNNTNNNDGNSRNDNNGNNNDGTNTEKTGTRKRYTITRATTKLANGTTGVIIFDNKQGYTISYPSGNRLINATGSNYSAALTDEKIDELNLEKYRSGGYTGNWNRGISTNEDGRLAVLHQKELVLNQSDTSNMLKMIQAVRDIVQLNHNINASGFIDSFNNIGQMQSSVLSKINSDALQAIASTITTNNSETQNYKNMTVNADFSGVRSADAIYQALVELENYGMQQAYSNAPNANIRY